MPIYEYDCRACGEAFELLVLGSETPTCPSCAGTDIERKLSLPSVSSEATRQRGVASVKKRNRGIRQEQAAAEQARERQHHEDH